MPTFSLNVKYTTQYGMTKPKGWHALSKWTNAKCELKIFSDTWMNDKTIKTFTKTTINLEDMLIGNLHEEIQYKASSYIDGFIEIDSLDCRSVRISQSDEEDRVSLIRTLPGLKFNLCGGLCTETVEWVFQFESNRDMLITKLSDTA